MGRKSLIKQPVTFTSRKRVRLGACALPPCHGGRLQALLVLPFDGARPAAPGASGELPSPQDADGQSELAQPCSAPPGTSRAGATRAETELGGDDQGRVKHHQPSRTIDHCGGGACSG